MYVRIRQNNKWGYFDPETNKSIECKYLRAYNFVGDYAIVRDESYKSGVIDIDGATTIPFVYNKIERGNDGCFRVYVNDLSCLINLDGTLLDEKHNAYPSDLQVYDVVQELSDNRFIVAKGGVLGIYHNGTEAIKCKFFSIHHLDTDLFIVNDSDSGNYGLINSKGQIIIPTKYHKIGRQNSKLIYGEKYGWDFYSINGELKCHINNAYGKIEAIVPIEDDTYLIKHCDGPYKANLWEGVAILTSNDSEVRLGLNYDYYGFFHHGVCEVGKEARIGLIDNEGTELVHCVYTSIEYSEHYALLSKLDSLGLSSVFNKTKVEIFSFSEKKVISTKQYISLSRYEDGYALVCDGHRHYGVINSYGVETIPCSFSKIEETEEPNIVRAISYFGWEYYKKSGERLFKNSFGQYNALPTGIIDCKSFSEGLAIIRNSDHLVGFMTDTGKIAIPCKFGLGGVSVSDFSDGSARLSKTTIINYHPRETGDYSYIDRNGNFIVTYKEKPIIIDGNGLQFVFPFEGDVARAIDVFGKWGLIAPNGNHVSRFDYKEIHPFYNHEAIITIDKKMGVIDDSGACVVPIKFTKLKRGTEGYIAREGTVDNAGHFIINGVLLDNTSFDECFLFEEHFIMVKKNGLLGLTDLTGKVLLPCEFLEIGKIENGYVHCQGESRSLLVSPSGDIIELPSETKKAKYYPNGLVLIEDKNWKKTLLTIRGGQLLKDFDFHIVDIKYNLIIYWKTGSYGQGVMDIIGNEVVPCEFKSLRFDSIPDSFIASFSDHEQRFDSHGNRVSAIDSSLICLNSKYSACRDFHDGLAAVAISLNQISLLWGYINSVGEEIIRCSFSQAFDFSCGLAKVYNGRRFGFIDNSGHIQIPYKYLEASDFHEGYSVTKEDDYRSLAVINTVGEYVISPNSYEYLDYFHEGLALAKGKNHLFGFIGEDGKTVIPFVFKSAKPFCNGESSVVIPHSEKEYRIDRKGRIIVFYEGKNRTIEVNLKKFSSIGQFHGDRALLYYHHGLTGVISINGNILIEPQHFENLCLASDGRFCIPFGEKRLFVTSDGSGLIDEDGVLMDIDPQYKVSAYLTDNLYEVQDIYNENCRGVSNNSGSIIIPGIYSKIEVLSDKKHLLCTKEYEFRHEDEHEWEYRHVYNLSGEQIIIDGSNKEICKCKYSSYEWVDSSHCVIEIDGGHLKALINSEGDYILTPGKYKDIGRFEDGFAVVTMYPFFHKEHREREDPDNGGTHSWEERVYDERFINEDGCLVTGLEGDCLTFDKEYKWYIENSDETISVYDGKHWGLLDKELNLLVNCIYQEQFKFNGSYAIVKSKMGAGLIDRSGRLVIKYQYDRIECYPKYGIAYGWKETLVTVHNIKGEKLIEFDCDEVYPLSNKYTKFRRLKDRDWKWSGSLAGFISHETGKECFGFNDVGVLGDGLISIQNKDKSSLGSKTWGFANLDGEIVIPCDFIKVYGFRNGQALVTDQLDNTELPANRRLQSRPIDWEDRYRWGTIRADGSVKIPLVYRNLLYVKDTSFRFLYGSYEGINTYLNAEGEPVSVTEEGRLVAFPGYYACQEHAVNGRILVYSEKEISVADTQANILVEARDYGKSVIGPILLGDGNLEVQLKLDSDTIRSRTMNCSGNLLTDKDGQTIVLPFKYIFAKEWVGDFISVMVGDSWGVIDSSFNEVIPCTYHDISVVKDKAIAKTDTGFHIIDLNTKDTISIVYDQASMFTDGLLLVCKKTVKASSSRTLLGFGPEKNSYKYGLIDIYGQVVLDPIYDEITVLNPETEPNEDEEDSENDNHHRGSYYDNNRPSYGKYAGTYAQDVAGLSDDVIDDALDGDPDAYWNID